MNLPDQHNLPGLILVAHPDREYSARICQAFESRGWKVRTAATGGELRRLARRLCPPAVLLAAEIADESGWLICDKLVRQQPSLRVYLITDAVNEENRHFAEFVGAAGLFSPEDDVCQAVDEAFAAASSAG